MRVFKFVDPDHANALAAGSLKIGTFLSYSGLESPRKDEGEAIAHITQTLDHRSLTTANRRWLKKLGLQIDHTTGSTSLTDVKFYIANRYCFCVSASLDAAPAWPHAAFEITSFWALMSYITKANGDKLGLAKQIRRVRYLQKPNDILDYDFVPTPFVKNPRFTDEQELRCVWNKSKRSATSDDMERWLDKPNRLSQGLEPFVTPANSDAAQFISRIY